MNRTAQVLGIAALAVGLATAVVVGGDADRTPPRAQAAAATSATRTPAPGSTQQPSKKPGTEASKQASTATSGTTTPAPSSAEQRKQAAAARDKQAAVDDARTRSGSGASAAPPGAWRLGAIGTYLVGRGIPAGTYTSAASHTGTCHWTRLRGLSGASADVIADGRTPGPSTVTIKASDRFFQTSGCENWRKIG